MIFCYGGHMSGVRSGQRLTVCVGLIWLAVLTDVCSSAKSTQSTPVATGLWGEMKPVVSVKELMRDMLDPAGDNIFDSVNIAEDKNGPVERVPKTDEDWEKIRIGAVTLAEGSYLLKVQR